MTDLSVVIVTYNVRDLLSNCLISIDRARAGLEIEVFVVDNASQDDTVEVVREHFPWVTLLEPGENLGFAKANNLALKQASGRHLMILNPDTVVQEHSLRALVDYLDQHPEAGAAGPKVLDPDGSFQTTSKRGLPTPWASFCKLSGLSALFPRSAVFNRYELGHLDPDERHEVEVLYGAAMMVRREAYEKAGGLDESYFMYGEDIAWSDAIRKAGYTLVYLPDEPIVHIKGESTRRSDTDRDAHFFGAMRIFARQHFNLSLFSRLLIDLGVGLALLLSRVRARKRQWGPALLDLALVWLVFWTVLPLSRIQPMGIGPALLALVFAAIAVVVFAQAGMYRKTPPRTRIFLVTSLLTFALFTAFAYFFRSRLLEPGVTALAGAFALVDVVGWRLIADFLRYRRGIPKALVVGTDPVADVWLEKARQGGFGPMMLVGCLAWDAGQVGDSIAGLPVLGTARELDAIVRRWRIRRVVLSAGSASYAELFRLVEATPLRSAKVELIDESLAWDAA